MWAEVHVRPTRCVNDYRCGRGGVRGEAASATVASSHRLHPQPEEAAHMSRSIVRTAAAVATAAALAGAPAAFARPADQGARLPAAVPHLTLAQLKAVDGHQPPAPPISSPVFTRVTPVHSTQPGGNGTSPVPWIAGGVALLLFTAIGVFRYTGVRPARRRQPAA
jgi:hypothetical protein